MKKFLVAVFLVLMSLAIIGCEGDDGEMGITGDTGVMGLTGPSGMDEAMAEAKVPAGYHADYDEDGHVRWCADGYHLIDKSGDGEDELCYGETEAIFPEDADDDVYYQHEYVPSLNEVLP